MTTKTPIAVCISGRGSNLQAFIDACARDDYPACIVSVLSNNADAYGLERAKQAGISTQILDHRNYENRETYDMALHEALHATGADYVCLAGFMRLLTAGFVDKWQGRLLNIHPSLLPKFPGLNTHEAAIAAGEKEHGCTVHFVTEKMDAGPVILQASVPVLAGDTPDTLATRVLEQEHVCYPKALQWVIEGKVRMEE